MERVLVDTDVFSFLLKNDSRAAWYEAQLRGRATCLSFMTIAELKQWALAHNWGAPRKASLESAIQATLVLPFTDVLTDHWASIKVERTRIGKPIECGDCWVAATAVRYGLPLMTHNSRHFAGITGLSIISRAE